MPPMAQTASQELLVRETRVHYGSAPRGLGGERVAENCWQLVGNEFLLRTGAGHWFHYRQGSGITIERGRDADHSAEPLWLSGSVYSAVAAINGFFPIHASAVCHEGQVYAFNGPSGAGKSTLVTALANRGFPLFCDDTLVLDLSDPGSVQCLPGHKRLKLTEEALALTGAAKEEKVGAEIDKYYAKPQARYAGEPLPLAQLVILEEGDPCGIQEIPGARRLVCLDDDHYTAHYFTLARQLDAVGRFTYLSRVARRIAMSRFTRPRDLARFSQSVAVAADFIVGQASS